MAVYVVDAQRYAEMQNNGQTWVIGATIVMVVAIAAYVVLTRKRK